MIHDHVTYRTTVGTIYYDLVNIWLCKMICLCSCWTIPVSQCIICFGC